MGDGMGAFALEFEILYFHIKIFSKQRLFSQFRVGEMKYHHCYPPPVLEKILPRPWLLRRVF